ncbi:MAG TPA: TlpA disulfide reductase family protein [Polyangiales bacterium]|nr:TlpA disulfide reductase family protein [Polyangiales bacterium]
MLATACVAKSAASTSTTAAQQLPVLEMTLARPDGSRFELGAMRGKPMLLFLFATYDDPSQLALNYLERTLRREPDLATLGIALQPDAASFLEPYRSALSVSFPLSFDPNGDVLHGQTALGRIASIPCFVVLDAEGHIVATRYGVLREAELHELIEKAR